MDMRSKSRRRYSSRLVLVAAWAAMAVWAQTGQIPAYTASHRVSGVVRTWGSPQMADLLKRYEAGFHKLQPGVRFEDELYSTITGVAGVYAERAEIGVLGREVWPLEAQAYESVKGHAPTSIEVATGAYDVPRATFALMVFVHRSNPLASLSTAQLEQVFGSMDGGRPVQTWGDLGLAGEWSGRPVHLYGFQTENDKAIIFQRMIFKQSARWSCGLREFGNGPGAHGVDAGERIVHAVSADPEGIGISNVHYATRDVRALAIAASISGPAVAPTRESVAARTYPLTRAVYFVVDRSTEHPWSEATAEFVDYVLSSQGAEDVLSEGNYLPLPAAVAEAERTKLGLAAAAAKAARE